MLLKPCEIIYVKQANGWKWRTVSEPGAAKPQISEETFRLYYECVSAARAHGYYNPAVKCP